MIRALTWHECGHGFFFCIRGEKNFCTMCALVMYIEDDNDRGATYLLSTQSTFGLSFGVFPYRLPRSVVVVGDDLLLLIRQN